jgi:hypothetical protein
MKLQKSELTSEITLRLNEVEFLIILAALKNATADHSRRGIEHVTFYGCDKGDVVRLHNEIDEANRRLK